MVDYRTVRREFDALPQPGEELREVAYSTVVLPPGYVRIGKNKKGSPVLLVPTTGGSGGSLRDRHFANLRVRHTLQLRLAESDPVGRFSVVECLSSDEAVRDWFLRLVPGLREQLQAGVAPNDLDREITRVAELFRVIGASGSKRLEGLWAEILLISRSTDPKFVLECWHSLPHAVHDFTGDGHGVEVKATEGGVRRHHFTHQQLGPSHDVLVGSVLLQQTDRGCSVMDLYDELLRVVGSNVGLQHKLNVQVMSAVGLRLAEAESIRFDADAAIASLILIRAEDVPQVTPPFPAGVTDVRFMSDLSLCQPVASSVLEEAYLWRCLPGRGV